MTTVIHEYVRLSSKVLGIYDAGKGFLAPMHAPYDEITMKSLLLPAFSILHPSCAAPQAASLANDLYAHPCRNQHRQNMRVQGRQHNPLAFESSWQDGQAGKPRRQIQNDRRHSASRFGRNSDMAYHDGYNQGYSPSNSSQNPLKTDSIYPESIPRRTDQDTSCQQGYENGLRDRLSARVADPAAHLGRCDSWKRTHFELGHYDGYNSLSP